MTIKIEAAQRLNAKAVIRKPSIKIVLAEQDKLLEALESVCEWIISSKRDTSLVKDIKVLVDMFGYSPYNKPVYRAFPISREHIAKVIEGEVYKLKTGRAPVQSWTTSISSAVDFYMHKQAPDNNYCVCKLLSAGKEIMNHEWLLAIVSYLDSLFKSPLLKRLDIYNKIEALRDGLQDFEKEDEVVMLLPPISKVQLILVMNWSNRVSIRQGATVIEAAQRLRLTAGLSPILYHITTIDKAANIMEADRFELKPSEGTAAEEKLSGAKYYMSLSRIKNAAYTVKQAYTYSVIFVLNGQKLGERYSGKAVDYWSGMYSKEKEGGRADRFEAEDSLSSAKPIIPYAHKYILEVHVCINDRMKQLFMLKKRCLLNHIPIFFYSDYKDMVTQNKKLAVEFHPTTGTKTTEPLSEYERKYWKQTNHLSPWIALYEIPVKKGVDPYTQIKSMKNEKIYDSFCQLRYDAVSSFECDLHNAKSADYDSSSHERQALDKLIGIMRNHKWGSKEFVTYLSDKWHPQRI